VFGFEAESIHRGPDHPANYAVLPHLLHVRENEMLCLPSIKTLVPVVAEVPSLSDRALVLLAVSFVLSMLWLMRSRLAARLAR
jgi:hypothetical protein